MDDERIVQHLVQVICRLYGGSVHSSQLVRALGSAKCAEYFGDAKPEIYFLQRRHMFTLEREGNGFIVGVTASLTLCTDYRSKGGCKKLACSDLHLCKQFILGTCPFGDSAKGRTTCHFSHKCHDDPHNGRILHSHNMTFLDPDDIKVLIRQSDVREFSPGLCRAYSSPAGCPRGDKCHFLHLCRKYATGRPPCKFGKKCKFNHHLFHPQPSRILQRFGIDTTKPEPAILSVIRKGLFAPKKTRDTDDKSCDNDDETDEDDDNEESIGELEFAVKDLSIGQQVQTGSGDLENTEGVSDEKTSKAKANKKRNKKKAKNPTQEVNVSIGESLAVQEDIDECVNALETGVNETQTSLSTCNEYRSKGGCKNPACSDLHLCKQFILGTCPFEDPAKGRTCHFSHKCHDDPHNGRILHSHNMTFLDPDDIKVLIRQSDVREFSPGLCRPYSSPAGCPRGDKCHFLHLCRKYATGRPPCKFGKKCKFSHHLFHPQPRRILQRFGIDTTKPEPAILSIIRKGLFAPKKTRDTDDKSCDNDDETDLDVPGFQAGNEKSGRAKGGKGRKGTRPKSAPQADDTTQPGQTGPANTAIESKSAGVQKPVGQTKQGKGRGGKAQKLQPHERRASAGATSVNGAPDSRQKPAAAKKQAKQKTAAGGAIPKPQTPAQEHADRPKGKDAPKVKESDKEAVICLPHLDGQCPMGEGCKQFHFALPYSWQKFLSKDRWETLPKKWNEVLENEFCDVSKEKIQISPDSTTKVIADFNKMKMIDLAQKTVVDLRRLSTYPSAIVTPPNKLAVEWLWYWKDGDAWRKYGEQGKIGSATVRSGEIEVSYRRFKERGEPVSLQLSVGLENEYVIHFGQMTQQNLKTSVKRDVRRRPRYLSASDVKAIKAEKKKASQKPARKGAIPPITANPKHWDRSAVDRGGYSLVAMSDSGTTKAEYQEIAARFHETMPDDLIVSVERVQNHSLWAFFSKRYELMKQRSAEVDVRHLFHGTAENYVDAICRQNFDWRLSGSRVGTKYGKGSYFAKTAKFADSYIATDDLYRKMFFARVLVGDCAPGEEDYVRPPAKNPNNPLGDLYDSCADKVANPKIFVIFEASQAYPEFIITYMKHEDMEKM